MSDSQFYLDHIYATSSGYRATWDPTTELRIGDIVKLDEYGVCNVFSSLEEKGIKAEIRSSHSTGDKDYSSGSGLEINIKTGAEIPPAGSLLGKADVGFNIQFKSGKNIVFKISGYTEEKIINLEVIETAVIENYKSGKWDKDSLVITHLIKADSATIIISEQGNNSVDIKATAEVKAHELKLTNASLGLQFLKTSNTMTNIVAQNGITPLYKAMGLKVSLFGSKDLVPRSIDGTVDDEADQEEALEFAEITQ